MCVVWYPTHIAVVVKANTAAVTRLNAARSLVLIVWNFCFLLNAKLGILCDVTNFFLA